MTQTNPPRFVPTLTETLTDGNIPSTVSDDSRYLQQRRLQEPDSMLDLDLGELETSGPKVAHVPPLSEYQRTTVSAAPHTGGPAARDAGHAAAPVRQGAAASVQGRSALADAPVPASSAGSAAPMPSAAARAAEAAFPADWQRQLQEHIQRAVRQELQQQLPFMLLQWSQQIEEKLSPQLQAHLVRLIESWRAAR